LVAAFGCAVTAAVAVVASIGSVVVAAAVVAVAL
jgi:hypothetical protein